MRLKTFSWSCLAAGILFAAIGFITPIIKMANHGPINIIGGADVPTYRFLLYRCYMDGLLIALILLGVSLIITAVFSLVFQKTVKTHCGKTTSLLSVSLAAVGAMGVACFLIWFSIVSFGEMSKNPIAYPLSMFVGLLSLIGFMALIYLYLKCRKKKWSIKGFIIDIFTAIIYLPTFIYILLFVYNTVQ